MTVFSYRELGLALAVAAPALVSAAEAAEPAYAVRISGAPDNMQDPVRAVSDLVKETRPYPTAAAIRLTGERDARAMRDVLVNAGWYGAVVTFQLSENAEDALRRYAAAFAVEPGAKFSIAEHRIVYDDDAPNGGDRPTTFEAMGVKPDNEASGAALKQNQEEFLSGLWDAGFPGAKITGRRALADYESQTSIAEYRFESGPHARFGGVEPTGLDRTRNTFLEKLKTWEPGDYYSREKLIAFRDDVSATGIFSSVDAAPGAVDKTGAVPVIVTLEERKRRTVGAGVSFSTVEGPGGRLFLEYRNMFGAGEKARAQIEATRIEQSVSFSFDKPFPTLPGGAFANLSFINQTTDAFDARTVALAAGLAKRWLNDTLETRAAVALETSNIRTDLGEERVFLVSLPLTAIFDTETDPLALDRGARMTLNLTPYTGTDTFTQAEFTARSRVNFGADDRFTLAARTRLGATFGSSLLNLPANKRYFSGGGSSVRGFEFQAVGPADADGAPIGGRSVIEAAIEARAGVAGPVQLAAFIDTGSVSTASVPDFAGDYQTGVGGGLRYLSPIGPLRVDAAIPVERRENDPAWQVYISLGQPF